MQYIMFLSTMLCPGICMILIEQCYKYDAEKNGVWLLIIQIAVIVVLVGFTLFSYIKLEREDNRNEADKELNTATLMGASMLFSTYCLVRTALEYRALSLIFYGIMVVVYIFVVRHERKSHKKEVQEIYDYFRGEIEGEKRTIERLEAEVKEKTEYIEILEKYKGGNN